jgi:hypothetical protein
MSPDEKLIAQWEAQHDVAARGHRGDPLGLQRSLSRERLAEQCRPPRGATASRDVAAQGQPPAAEAGGMPGPAPGEGQAGPRRHPWRRFHHHASEH